MRLSHKIILSFFIVATLLGLWSFFIEPNLLTVHRATIRMEKWPKVLDGLKIAVIADVHAGAPFIKENKLQRIVEETQKEKPDLIVLLGDYVIQGVVGGSFIAPEVTASYLRQLSAPLGVYAVLGNHDCWMDCDRMARAFNDVGIRVLQDEFATLSREDNFYLVGLKDHMTQKTSIPEVFAKLSGKFPIVVLTHGPDIFPQLPPEATLTLAGHTHGGQVKLPLIGTPIVPSDYGSRYVKGIIHENGKTLYVSSGIGTSLIPVRFLVPPEIVILSLTSSP